jgi:hypothetical protein
MKIDNFKLGTRVIINMGTLEKPSLYPGRIFGSDKRNQHLAFYLCFVDMPYVCDIKTIQLFSHVGAGAFTKALILAQDPHTKFLNDVAAYDRCWSIWAKVTSKNPNKTILSKFLKNENK